MSEPTPIPPAQPAGIQPPVATQQPPAAPAKPRKRRRRRWLWAILILLPVLLILLVLLAPTLLSIGAVRAMILPSVSKAVAPNGKLDIQSWSFGWFSGQHINGITLLDDQNAAVAHLNVKTDASLWSLIRGNYAVGDTKVDGDFDVRIDPHTGRVNALHIMGLDQPSTTQPSKPNEPSKPSSGGKKDDKLPIDLSKVSGTLTLNLNGTISSTDPADHTIPFTKVEHGNFVVDLNHLEQGTKLNGDLALNVDGKPASIKLDGTADLIENNAIITDPNAITANLVASVQQLDLSIVNAALTAAGVKDVDVAGVLKGRLLIDVQPGGAAVVKTEDNFGIDNFAATAPQLKGDTFKSQRIDLPISITRAAGSDEIKIESFALRTQLASLSVTGTLPQSGLQNLAAKRAPGATGQLVIVTDVPEFARVVAMFPNLAKLQQGVVITKGGLHNQLTVNLKPDRASLAQSLRIEASGTANDRPIQIQPITLETSADVALRDGLNVQVNDLLGFNLAFGSSFATINGSGVPTKATITGSADLDKLRSEVAQFIDLGAWKLQGATDFSLKTDGDPIDTAKPLAVTTGFHIKNINVANGDVAYVGNENINGDVDVLLTRSPQKQVLTFRTLAVHSDSGLFDVEKVGDSAWFALFSSGDMGGVGQIKVGGALDRLLTPFMTNVDPTMRLNRGRLAATVTFALDEATKLCKADVDATISRLTVGNALNDENVHLTASAALPADFSGDGATAGPKTVKVDRYGVDSSFVKVNGAAEVRIADSSKATLSPFDMARSATFQGTVPSLPKLYALLNGFGLIPPETKVDEAGKPLPPLRIDGGTLAFEGNVARNDQRNVTNLTLTVPSLSGLAVSRGDNRFAQSDPINLQLAADLTTDTTKATVAEQLQRVAVSKLEATMPGLANVHMGEPIEIVLNPNGKPTAKGQVSGDANLDNVGSLLAVVQGKNPVPYKGNATFTQRINNAADQLTAVGNVSLTDLAPVDPQAQPLPEKVRKLDITNDVGIDSTFTTLTLNKAEVVAPDARDVLRASVVGTVRQLMTQNQMDGVKATVAYDIAQLWPLVQPVVDPTGQSIGKVQDVAGKYEKTFTVSGSYPMVNSRGQALTFNQSIKFLQVAGDIQLDRFNATEKGVDISNLTVPLTVNNGVAKIAYADGRSGGAFDINGGKGNLSGISVDLSLADPLLGDLRDQKLVTGATLNPILSQAAGKFLSPMFATATKATGILDVTVSTNGLRLGKLITTERSGAATMIVKINNLEIGNPIGENLLGGKTNSLLSAIGADQRIDTSAFTNFTGSMDATFRLSKGVVTQDTTFTIGQLAGENGRSTTYPLKFAGDIRLSDTHMDLTAALPLKLLKDRVGNGGGDIGKLVRGLPDTFTMPWTGTTTHPEIDSRELLGLIARSNVLGAIGGNNNNGGRDATNNGGNANGGNNNGLGGIIGDVLRGNKDDRSKNDQPTTERDDGRDDNKKTQAQKRREAEEQQRREAEDQQRRDAQQRRDQPTRDDTPRRSANDQNRDNNSNSRNDNSRNDDRNSNSRDRNNNRDSGSNTRQNDRDDNSKNDDNGPKRR